MTDFQNGWLYEAGIGENRALRVADGELVAVRVERGRTGATLASIVDAQFTEQWVAGRSGIVTLASGEQGLLQPLPKGLTEGASVRVEIVREALDEKGGQSKRAKARPAAEGSALTMGPSLLDIIEAGGEPVRTIQAHEPDRLSAFGWNEAMEQAETGRIDFDGGSLLVSLTPAMTVIDVDGPLAPYELAKRAAKAVALALTRFDIGGSIGVDFPTLEAKAERTEVSTIFDQHMAGKCERTAINGFGLMQVVARKTGPSVLEVMQADKVLSATLALLRQAERTQGTGALQLDVHPAVAAKLNHPQAWLDALSKRTGRDVSVEAKGDIPIAGGQIS
ncbi:ribonuclease E/G [Parasphingorhabdus cellanae]|uniref:Ribonuclease E/G n=1 Tax=Parasphingorhabdus cellanae TaxID=2806553 RepID=A0ABX7T1T2_9SPHN|nr:ribonuclease E/G [Parasphingorhabdus cellanae]QTD55521.1 ribonuclease E/G [Parasphingorhabdus cellanae]